MSPHEIFDLELLGGAVERRYRKHRPHPPKMPWGTLDLSAYSEDALVAGRRGWTDLAIQEYAAAASQANVLRLVVRARAPLDLSAMLATFPLDELVHTELCAQMAEELGGAAAIAYPVAEVFPEPAQGRGSLLAQAARAVAWEFCVGETLSHGLLAYHHKHAAHPLLEAVWGRLAKDEAAHARFGWLFMDWVTPLLTPEERTDVATTIARAVAHAADLDAKVTAQPSEAFLDVGVFGSRGKEAYLAKTHAILEERVVRRLASRVAGSER